MTPDGSGALPSAFDRSARVYDQLVRANPGYHKHLRRSAARLGLEDGGADLRVLDVGCGTGASTAALLRVAPRARVVAVDASGGMLEHARRKSWPSTVTFVQARAEELAADQLGGPFDAVLAAYLVRNLADIDAGLGRLRQLLRPGGRLAVHEYSVADSPLRRAVWSAMAWSVIIPAGRLLSGEGDLYRYLWRSVREFDGARMFAARLHKAGYSEITVAPMTGWQRGIVHTFLARRPLSESSHAPGHRDPETGEPETGDPETGEPAMVAQPGPPGRDHRAVRIVPQAPRSGTCERTASPHTAVIGGGIAGVAAAVALAERGVSVTLLEGQPQLGGRLRSWRTTLADRSEVSMSRGFHAFFRQYYNLRALLRRVDPDLRCLSSLGDYPLTDAQGRVDTFDGLPRTPPWNAVAFALRSPTFTLSDLVRLNARAAWPLIDVRVPRTYAQLDEEDAASFLERLRFPAPARHLAFSVFSRSFFADPAQLSAAELATMFHLYFLGSNEGLPFDVVNRPFSEALWEPLGRYLEQRGVTVRTGCSVEAVRSRPDGRLEVEPAHGETVATDGVVLALDVPSLRNLVERSPGLGDASWRARIARQPVAPPFLVSRLWLRDSVAPERPGFVGSGGLDPLDNVSVLERFDDDARCWAGRTGGSVVELHAYALSPARVADGGSSVATELRHRLDQVYPELHGVASVDERHELRADCPLFPPGGFADRVGVTTPDPRVMVAGDLVRVDLPVALMERAATSGFQAANQLLVRWGRVGHTLWSVPTAGRRAPLRWLAAWAARRDSARLTSHA